MQRIERYGVIALVLLLVTIAAVSFWDDGQPATPETGPKANTQDLASLRQKSQKPPKAGPVQQRNTRRGSERALPATGRDQTSRSQGQANSGAQSPRSTQRKPGSLTRRSSTGTTARKPSFETLPANVVDGGSSLSERGFDRDETGKRYGSNAQQQAEVEFPNLPPRQQPVRNDARGLRNTPYQPAADSRGNRELASSGARSGSSTYVVKSGDTLSEIASRMLGSSKRWTEIQALNGGLDPAAIQVGMQLKLPAGAAAPSNSSSLNRVATLESKAIPPRAPDGSYYTVRPGDMLSKIAQDHLGGASRWPEIVALNPGLDPDVLIEGRRLRMPSSTGGTGAVAQANIAPKRKASKTNRVR